MVAQLAKRAGASAGSIHSLVHGPQLQAALLTFVSDRYGSDEMRDSAFTYALSMWRLSAAMQGEKGKVGKAGREKRDNTDANVSSTAVLTA